MNHSRAFRTAALALFGAYLALFTLNSLERWRHFTPDSMNYVDVARNLRDGRGLVQSTLGFNQPSFPAALASGETFPAFLVQPPLHPVLIAAVSRIGVPAADAALLLCAALYALVLGLTFALARRLFDDSVALVATACLVVFTPLAEAARSAWSEPLGVVCLLVSLLALARSREDDGGRTAIWAAAAGLAAGLAFATRFAFAPLVLFGGGALLLVGRGGTRVRRCLQFLLGALIVALPVVVRYVALGGMELPRDRSDVGVLRNVERGVTALTGRWNDLLPSGLETALTGLAFVAIFMLLRRRTGQFGLARLLRPGARWLLLAWSGVYLVFLVAGSSILRLDPINPRLVLPASVPLAIPVVALAVQALGTGLRGARAFFLVLIAIGCVWEAGTLMLRPAVGAEKEIHASARLRWIAAADDDLILGDDTMDVPFYFHRPAVSFSPYPWHHPVYEDVLAFVCRERGEGGEAYLVLRNRSGTEATWRGNFGPFIADLASGRAGSYPGIALVDSLDDARVFRIRCPAP